MGICTYCGTQETMPFRCKFCGEQFCGAHRLPENHDCIGLKKFKEARGKTPGKWVYSPFHKKYRDRVGREVQRPISSKFYEFLEKMTPRKALYIILAIIVILILYRTFTLGP